MRGREEKGKAERSERGDSKGAKAERGAKEDE